MKLLMLVLLVVVLSISAMPAASGDYGLEGATFLGGANSDNGIVIAADDDGHIYVAGDTYSEDFPVTDGAFDTTFNGIRDIFVAKLTDDCGELVWATYVGGGDNDLAYGIEVDHDGYVFVTGRTDSTDFPTTSGAYQEAHAGDSDVVVFKLATDGSDLEYSTFVGGVQYEVGYAGVAVDGSGMAYVAGHTNSPNFPTTEGAYDRTYYAAGWDGFAFKLNEEGSDLVYSTYFGGWDYEGARDIVIDGNGHAAMTGDTTSNDFPTTTGAYDTIHNGGRDYFILELNADGSDLVFSTFLGGSAADVPNGISRSADGPIWVAGYSLSEDFPTTSDAYSDALTGTNDDRDFTVSAISQEGSDLVYSTYIGGTEADEAGAVVHSMGAAHVVGRSFSTDFPTTEDATDRWMEGKSDMVFLTLRPGPDGLYHSTFVGRNGTDGATGLVRSESGFSMVGYTNSSDFPVSDDTYDESFNGGHIDAGIATIGIGGSGTWAWVSVEGPVEGATVEGTITISGTASSPGVVELVEVSFDGGGWSEAVGTESWTFVWDTASVEDGPHIITARMGHDEGADVTASITVTVDNIAETGTSDSGNDDGIPGFDLVLMTLALVAVTAVRGRRRGRP